MVDLSDYITGRKEAKDIWKVYFDAIPELPVDKRQHITVRANLAGLCDERLVKSMLRQYSKTVNEKIDLLRKGDYSRLVEDLSKIYTESPSVRKVSIGKYFLEISKNPEVSLVVATGAVAEAVDIYMRTGNSNMIDIGKFHECYVENIDSIEKFMSGQEFFDHHLQRAIVSFVNTWWYLRNISDGQGFDPSGRKISVRILERIREWLSDKYLDGTGDMESVVYGLTHIVIGASRFYTRQVGQEYIPELELLADSLSKGMSREDIRLETVLCLKLSGMPQWQYLVQSEIKKTPKLRFGNKYIVKNFESTGDNLEDIIHNEHTNSLYLLCCSTRIP